MTTSDRVVISGEVPGAERCYEGRGGQALAQTRSAQPAASSAATMPSDLRPQSKIHRVGPDFGSTLTASNRDSHSNCWVNF